MTTSTTVTVTLSYDLEASRLNIEAIQSDIEAEVSELISYRPELSNIQMSSEYELPPHTEEYVSVAQHYAAQAVQSQQEYTRLSSLVETEPTQDSGYTPLF